MELIACQASVSLPAPGHLLPSECVVWTPQSSFWKPDVCWPDVRAYWMANCRVPGLLNAHFLHLALGEVPGQRCPSQTTQAVCKACLLSLLPAVAPPPPPAGTKASPRGWGAGGGGSLVCGALPRPPWLCEKPACYPSSPRARPPPPVSHQSVTAGFGGERVVWGGSQYPLDTSAPRDRHAALGRMDG